ncbi:hypothetical protein MF271_16320 [Deinococcus sp. KNUC1210]|uniref:hypothetical protein n=1 Tax=Deinococcus sp. KNUC1210 TaxID=2917691 RepID=UPI001EF0181F|nr:hypothetical protein [Deinococcus sp. KNUC1210]ULH15462.1 hypothetical protein MF271_16320 [Deinococcus sp. KNUC1210]
MVVRALYRWIGTAAMYGVLATSSALALTVPMADWTSEGGDSSTWTDSAEACVLHEETLPQNFPALTDSAAATRLAVKMQQALLGQKLQDVVTQPLNRGGTYAVLAAYGFAQSGVQYRAVQLFLSDGGRLRTVTGSYSEGEASPCVLELHDFLRNTAN